MMSQTTHGRVSVRRMTTVLAWLVVPTCIIFFLADRYLNEHYPLAGYFSPARRENLIGLRNVSLVALLLFTLA